MAVEDGRADDCVHDVIRESHSADRGQPTREGKQRQNFAGQHDCANPAEADQQTGPIVELHAVEEGVTKIPSGCEITMRAIERERNAVTHSDGNHRPIH